MSPRRDTDLGEKLAVFDAPTHGDRYWDKVDREISSVPSSDDVDRSRRRGWLRPAVAAAAALAACAVLALALAGLPGTTRLGPAPAGAVGRLLAAVDSGLARVRTLQGTMLTVDSRGVNSRAHFAATAAGDASVDQPLPVTAFDLRNARRTYRQDLADMRAGRQRWDRVRLRQDRTVGVRRQWAGDAATRVMTGRVWLVDAFTLRPAGVAYFRDVNSDGRFVTVPDPAAPDAANVWGVSSAVRVAIASHPDAVTLSDTVFEGRTATRAILEIAGRRWEVVIDKRYGIVLSFAPQEAATVTGSAAYEAFRIVDLRINKPVDRVRFTIPPVFSLDARYRPIPYGLHDPMPYTQDDGYSTTTVPRAVRAADSQILLPTRLPSGFRLAPIATSYSTSTSFWFVRGLDSAELTAAIQNQFPQRDRATWVDLGAGSTAASRGTIYATRGGALDGWPMRLAVPDLQNPGTADWHNAGIDQSASDPQIWLRGVLTRQQFVDMAASLRPYGGWGILHRPAYHYARLLLIVTMGVVVSALLVELLAWRRARAPRRGLRAAELTALAGCVALALSMWLPWYRLDSTPLRVHYELVGGSIAFAVGALACGLGAALVALLRAAMGGWHLPARESILLAVFGAFALAFVLDVRLVQPDQARFYLGDLSGGTAVSPTPWVGLVVGLAGVAAILVAALLARGPRSESPGRPRRADEVG